MPFSFVPSILLVKVKVYTILTSTIVRPEQSDSMLVCTSRYSTRSTDLSPAIQSFLDYMNGVIAPTDSYIEQLQKDLDYYVDSGERNYDMDKYQAILDETARKAAKKARKESTKNTIISYISTENNKVTV